MKPLVLWPTLGICKINYHHLTGRWMMSSINAESLMRKQGGKNLWKTQRSSQLICNQLTKTTTCATRRLTKPVNNYLLQITNLSVVWDLLAILHQARIFFIRWVQVEVHSKLRCNMLHLPKRLSELLMIAKVAQKTAHLKADRCYMDLDPRRPNESN